MMVQTMTEPQASNVFDAMSLLPYAILPLENPMPRPETPAPGLTALIDAVSHKDQSFVPAVPQDLNEVGINESVIEELILKTIYSRGELIGRELAASLGLKFSLIERVVEQLKRQRLIQSNGSLGFGIVSSVFGISEAGRLRVRECLEHNQYVGPTPVPMAQYAEAVRQQRPKRGWLTKEALRLAYKGITVRPQVLSQIGPAVNSGKSFLIYGLPGNGKTYLAEALANLDSMPIYVPHAIEYQGEIIRVFDPVHHRRVDDDDAEAISVTSEARHDGRWVRCRRPFIVTGGELSINMLDLGYNPVTRVYDAPFQLKANNGIYLIDDFGRQKASPAEVLNRWIVPMERRVDYLSFHSGGKVEAPFDAFLVFSTNLQPEQLGDEAFLRRIQYKMLLGNPNKEEFLEILNSYCASQGLECSAGLANRLIEKHYEQTGKHFRRCHPRDVITHAIDIINFERLPMELTDEVVDQAFASCFASVTEQD